MPDLDLGPIKKLDQRARYGIASDLDVYKSQLDVPVLVAEVERLREALRVEREACDEWRDLYRSALDLRHVDTDTHNRRAERAAMMHDARRVKEPT